MKNVISCAERWDVHCAGEKRRHLKCSIAKKAKKVWCQFVPPSPPPAHYYLISFGSVIIINVSLFHLVYSCVHWMCKSTEAAAEVLAGEVQFNPSQACWTRLVSDYHRHHHYHWLQETIVAFVEANWIRNCTSQCLFITPAHLFGSRR